MQKLTLRMESELVDSAKDYAAQHGKSLSQLVADYFEVLTRQADAGKLPPVTEKLKGILTKGNEVTEQDYPQYLEDKYL
ncbi:DUF6364 family protein [Endozoicomonas sp.]|nr:DUF6364 family protein [Endozoicomonas sp.]